MKETTLDFGIDDCIIITTGIVYIYLFSCCQTDIAAEEMIHCQYTKIVAKIINSHSKNNNILSHFCTILPVRLHYDNVIMT